MKRSVVAAVVLASTVALGLPSHSIAQTAGPTLILEQDCYINSEGAQVYGVSAGVTGLPPNTDFIGRLEWTYIDPPVNPDGSYSTGGAFGPATFTTDATGSYGPVRIGSVGVAAVYTLTVQYAGSTLTKTLSVTCGPTTKDSCKNGGWRQHSFKNEGQCVAFVQRGERP